MELIERFECKFDKLTNGCWQWNACKNNNGYGEFSMMGSTMFAHRAAWTLYKGDIPKTDNYHSICVLHKCDNRLCVNPEHLFLGTNHDNVKDMFKKGRNPDRKGKNNGKSKLTEENVMQIRKLKKSKTYKEIANIFNVSESAIGHAATGRNWKHI